MCDHNNTTSCDLITQHFSFGPIYLQPTHPTPSPYVVDKKTRLPSNEFFFLDLKMILNPQ